MCGLNFGPLTIRKRFILLSSSLFSEYLPRINVSIVLGSSETLDLVGAVHLKLTTEIVIHCTRSKATDNYWAVNLVIKWMLALTDSKMITSRTLWDGRTGAMMIATRTPVATSDDKDYCATRMAGKSFSNFVACTTLLTTLGLLHSGWSECFCSWWRYGAVKECVIANYVESSSPLSLSLTHTRPIWVQLP